jgi:hypothetical protein
MRLRRPGESHSGPLVSYFGPEVLLFYRFRPVLPAFRAGGHCFLAIPALDSGHSRQNVLWSLFINSLYDMVEHFLRAFLVISIGIAVTSASCQKRYDLGISRIPYTGNELKINGFYYSPAEIGEGGDILKKEGMILLFFRNGIAMIQPVYIMDGVDSLQTIANLLQALPTEWMLRTSSGFGTFIISSGTLNMSFWLKEWDCICYQYEASILNDSTFMTTSFFTSKSSGKNWYKRVFHFKQYSPKPDSTCVFIE